MVSKLIKNKSQIRMILDLIETRLQNIRWKVKVIKTDPEKEKGN